MLTVPDLVVPRPVMHHRAKPTREVSGPRGHVQVKPREPAPPRPSPSDTSCRAGHPRQAAAPSGQRMRMRPKRPPADSGRGCARPPRLPRRMPRLDEAGRGWTRPDAGTPGASGRLPPSDASLTAETPGGAEAQPPPPPPGCKRAKTGRRVSPDQPSRTRADASMESRDQGTSQPRGNSPGSATSTG